MRLERYNQYFFHGWGDILTVEDFEYGYIPIPKCASTLLKNYFTQNFNFTKGFNYKNFKNKRYVVCLRDPIDRWFSGVTEYFFRFHQDIMQKENSDVIKFICDRKFFDEHTELQRNFLEGLDTDQITFFYMDKNLIPNLEHFVSCKFRDLNHKRINAKNLRNNYMYYSPEKIRFFNVLKQYATENTNFIESLTSFYQHDYDLIKRVRFYDRNDTDIL
jgi:hypothetical protein